MAFRPFIELGRLENVKKFLFTQLFFKRFLFALYIEFLKKVEEIDFFDIPYQVQKRLRPFLWPFS